MGVAPNGIPTGDDRESLFLLGEPFIFASRTFSSLMLRVAGLGFIKLARETLSKNEVLPGLTYFYCNWVSQGLFERV